MSPRGSLGSPRERSPRLFFWTSVVPPPIEIVKRLMTSACTQRLTRSSSGMVAMPDGPAMAAATCPVWTFESVKNTFVSSLQIAADSDAARKPLLEKPEFFEALLRLAYVYDSTRDEEKGSARGGGGRGKKKAEGAAFNPRVAAESLTAAVKSKLGVDGTPRADGADGEVSEIEATIIEKLPTVTGKLLALLEHTTG